jgi:HD superfamily phosphohydrolase
MPRERQVLLRDPIWDTIRLDETALAIVDTPAFQRLRYIKQLGHAHLVYPGATHTRFDHALGVYHLMRRALGAMRERGGLDGVDAAEAQLVSLAGLLHDIGHYPFSHAVEELEQGKIPGHHEALVGHFLGEPRIASALNGVSDRAAVEIEALIRGESRSTLQGLVSGSLDLDKIEYLKRDAWFCGVPYGDVDVDRLIHSLAILPDPLTGRGEVGVHEKGVAALESLLFSKYQMFRNVYWHHAVRAATMMYKRIVADALNEDLLAADELIGLTDEALLFLIESRAGSAHTSRVGARIGALRARRLPKRAAEVAAGELSMDNHAIEWLCSDSPLKRRAEDRIARELGLAPGDVFLDYPEKSAMFGLDLLVQRRSGEVMRLGPGGKAGLMGLPRVADELYRTARVLRLFTLGERRVVDPAALARFAAAGSAAATASLDAQTPLLQ